MHIEESLPKTVLNSWKSVTHRFNEVISQFSEEDLKREIAPGKNRVLYLLEHVTATNDGLFPLLGTGRRGYHDLDSVYLDQPDDAVDDPVAPSVLKAASNDVARPITEAVERFAPENWLRSTLPFRPKILLKILAVIGWRSRSVAPTTRLTI